MMDDDGSPLLKDCLISEALDCPSPGLPNVFLLDVVSEFNSDFALADLKPIFVGVNDEIPLDISSDGNNAKDHCYMAASESTSGSKTALVKPFLKFEPEESCLYSSPLPLSRVHKEICVKTEFYPPSKPTSLVIPQNLTVLSRQRSDDWSRTSESPGALSPDEYSDSSNGGSEYYSSSPAPSNILSSNNNSNYCHNGSLAVGQASVNFAVRTRSKMQELALQQNLITNQDTKSNGQLSLSSEERRTLIQEGYNVPTCLPLSKKDEEALKLVRRKIKNKLSAQESRKRRKEYIDTLEKRLHNYQTENNSLKRRVENLEQSNQSLIGQLRKLQATVGRSTNHISSPSAGVTLTAFLLLFAVLIPAIPVWPKLSFIAKSQYDQGPEMSATLAHQSSLHHSRVLTNDECDVPYSAGYFRELMRGKEDCDEYPDSLRMIPLMEENNNNNNNNMPLGEFANIVRSGFNNNNNLSEDVVKQSDVGERSSTKTSCTGLACHQTAVMTDS